MGDAEEVARFEVRHLNEGNYLSPRGGKVFLLEGKSDWGRMSTRWCPVGAYEPLLRNKFTPRMWFVGQSDGYGAIETKAEASTRSNGGYGVSPLAFRGVVTYLELTNNPKVRRPRG